MNPYAGFKFEPGRLVATPGAIEFCEDHAVNMALLLRRHLSGDWGDMDAEDRASNDAAVRSGGDRIFSSYTITRYDPRPADWRSVSLPGEIIGKIWIITEWDRSITTILLPEDY